MTLDRLRTGAHGMVTCLNLDEDTLHRVMAFGLIPGQTFHITRRAAFGGPIMLAIGTTHFMLRGKLARQIEVQAHA